MQFSREKLSLMSEQDVREEIIIKIISRLGYLFGETFYTRRAQKLTTLYRIGHKSPKGFPIGFPDYVCGIDGRRGSFIIEAKGGNIAISDDDLFQAHSYASHSDVGARFFILCNGHELRIYETSTGIAADPILQINNSDLENEFYKIEALLGPQKLMQICAIKYELKKPIAAGFGPMVTIRNGWASYSEVSYEIANQPSGSFDRFLASQGRLDTFKSDMNAILNRRQPVIAGLIERQENGKIVARAEFDSADAMMGHNLAAMQLTEFTFTTDAETISEYSEKRTAFESISEKSIPQGTKLYNAFSKQIERIGTSTKISLLLQVYGYIYNKTIIGEFFGTSNISTKNSLGPLLQINCEIAGFFNLNLDPP
jgi:hypothetical protein